MSRVDVVGLGRQPAGAGTKVTAMDYYVPVETSAPDDNQQELTIEETVGDRFPTGLDYGTRFFTIPLQGAPRPASVPRILSAFMGQPDTVAGAGADTGAFTHTFDPTLAGKVPEWHSAYVVRNDPNPPIVDLFWDARGNEVTFSCAPNDYLKMDATLIALDLDDTQSAPVPTTDVTQRWKFTQVVAEVSLDGGTTWTAIPCANASVTYQNNLDTDEAILGSRKLYALPFGNADCEVRFSPRQALATHYRRAMLADPISVAVRLTATGALIVPGGAMLSTFQWIVSACEYISAPAPVDGSSVLKMIEVTARAKKADNGKFAKAIIKNAVATY
jgi:hypothetical protein